MENCVGGQRPLAGVEAQQVLGDMVSGDIGYPKGKREIRPPFFVSSSDKELPVFVSMSSTCIVPSGNTNTVRC